MQLFESRRTSRSRRWWKRAALLAVALVVLGAWLGYRPAVEFYKQRKQQRALAQAKEFIEKRDAPNAQLALEVAIQAAPGNLDTLRTAAAMLEQVGAAQAMRLRRAVARAAPDSVDDAAALVLCCLRFHDLNAAKDSLASFPPAFAEKPAALRAALAYAIATNDAPVIDFLYAKLKAQFPADADLQVSHALLLLKHPNQEKRLAARADLERIAQSHTPQSLRVQRELGAFALAAREHAEARKWFDRVAAHPAAGLSDRLQVATLDLLVDKKPFDSVLPQLAPLAAKNEADAALFLQWLIVQRRSAEADRWLATLPKNIRDHRSILSHEPDLAAQLQDWDRFIALLKNGAWGPVSKETIRLVEAAQTISARDRPALRKETWDLAIQSAGGNLGTLIVLQRVAATWRWDAEIERTLWSIVRAFPDQTWAHQSLFDYYAGKKDTTAMRDVMSALQQSDASVARYRHDWALLTLLTNPSSGPTVAKETMQQLYESQPTNPNYVTGHAFALAQSRKPADAAALVQKLSPLERDYSPRQPYLAFIAGVARDTAALERAQKLSAGTTYLPEESRLFERAREELTRKPEKPAEKKSPPVKS